MLNLSLYIICEGDREKTVNLVTFMFSSVLEGRILLSTDVHDRNSGVEFFSLSPGPGGMVFDEGMRGWVGVWGAR